MTKVLNLFASCPPPTRPPSFYVAFKISLLFKNNLKTFN